MADDMDGLSMAPPPLPSSIDEETVDLDDDARLTAIDEHFAPFVLPSKEKASPTHEEASKRSEIESGDSDEIALTVTVNEKTTTSECSTAELPQEREAGASEATSCETTARSFGTALSFPTACSSSDASLREESEPPEGDTLFGVESRPSVAEKAEHIVRGETNELPTMEAVIQPEDDDEFGDFGDFEVSMATKTDSLAPTQSDTDPWAADFEEKTKEDDDDDWAADFAAASVPSSGVVKAPTTPTVAPLPLVDSQFGDSSLWDVDEGMEDESAPVDDFYDVLSTFEADSPSEQLRRVSSIEFSVLIQCTLETWLSLRVVEESRALKFVWSESRLHRRLLNVLSMRTPTSTPQMSSIDAVLKPTMVSFNPVTSFDTAKTNGTSQSAKPKQNGTVGEVSPPAPVPPADFDWSGSGLGSNPLDTPAATASLIDAGFFETPGGSGSGAFTLQKDLDAFGLSATKESSSLKALDVAPPSAVIEKLLRSGERKKVYRAPSELSLDARALHDRLPDIGFLSSKVLHFPIGKQ